MRAMLWASKHFQSKARGKKPEATNGPPADSSGGLVPPGVFEASLATVVAPPLPHLTDLEGSITHSRLSS